MERLSTKESIFSIIKNKPLNKIDLKMTFQMNEEIAINAELIKMQEKVKELRYKISDDKEDITQTIKDLEFILPTGNNNKKLNQIFFNSKIFIEVIECLKYTNQKFEVKLLNFIEKILKGNKHISNYLANNKEFIRTIFKLMKNENCFDSCIKICEEIFMNSQKLVPIYPFYKEIEENYKSVVEGTNLHTFCRILAIMVFDSKKMEFKQIFKYKEHLKIKPSPKVTTENQSICYHLPKFIHNLVVTLK